MDYTKRIQEIRKGAGVTQKQAAEMLEMNFPTYRNYEYGIREPGHAFLIKFAQTFGVTIDYVLGVSDIKKAPTDEGEREKLETMAIGIVKGMSSDELRSFVSDALAIAFEQAD